METPRWSFVSGPMVTVLDREPDLAGDTGRILLASTDPREVRQLRSILSAEAWEFTSAAGGEEALREISAAQEKTPASPRVIILGLPLSGPYGRLIIESARGSDLSDSSPVLALTREDSAGELRLAIEAGADQAVQRPINADDLVSRIRTLMQLQQARMAEKAARAMRRVAEEELAAMKSKSASFAGTLSHDLKNPLTGIMGHAQMLQMKFGSTQPEVESYATRIMGAARQVQQLLTDLRDLGLMEDGKLQMNIEHIDLRATLIMVLDGQRGEAEANGVELELVPSKPDSTCGVTMVKADADLLIRLLNTLVSDSLRHSPPEGLVRVLVGAPTEGRAEIHISDFADEVHDYAAGLFRNAGALRGGPDCDARLDDGLRMAFCQAVVAAHGGRIWVKPNAAGGRTIGLLLPAERGRPE